MIGALIGLFWVVATVVVNRSGGSSRQSGDNIERSGVFLIMWFCAFCLAVLALLLPASSGVLSLVALATAAVLVAPWPLASAVTLRRGWVRTTYALARLADFTFGRDGQGGGVLAAVIAARQNASTSPRHTAFIRGRFEKIDELRGAAAVALILERQQELSARELASWMDFQRFMDWRVTPPLARAVVAEWTATNALSRGDVAAALDVTTLVDSHILTHGERVAEQAKLSALDLIDAAARGDLDNTLCAGGTRAFATSSTLKLVGLACRGIVDKAQLSTSDARKLRRHLRVRHALLANGAPFDQLVALALNDVEKPGADAPLQRRSGKDPLTAAVDAHLQFVTQTRRPGEAQLHAFGLAWERVLYRDEVKASLLARARELGVLRPERALAAVEDSVAEALVTALSGGTRTGPPPDEESALLRMAREHAAEKPMEALEIMTGAVAMRVDAVQDLSIVDECEEMLRIYTTYRELAAIGPQARAEAFQTVANPITNWGIHLWNDRRQFSLANAIFRFVAYEAMVAGDEEFVRISLSNLGCRG